MWHGHVPDVNFLLLTTFHKNEHDMDTYLILMGEITHLRHTYNVKGHRTSISFPENLNSNTRNAGKYNANKALMFPKKKSSVNNQLDI